MPTKRNSCVTESFCNSNRDFQKMQQLHWKIFPAKIEKSLCKLFARKYAPNPVHNSVTIYRGEAFSAFWCVKPTGFFRACGRGIIRCGGDEGRGTPHPSASLTPSPQGEGFGVPSRGRLAPATVGVFVSTGLAIIKSRQSRPKGGFGRCAPGHGVLL